MIDTSLLRVFKAVADTGSVSAAAEQLHYVQPNVSARLAGLERELDTRLFYRRSRGMELTPEGRRLLPHAEEVLGRLEHISRGFTGDDFAGELRIGTTDTFASLHIASVAKALHDRYPRLDLSITTDESHELIESLLHYRLDAAFVEIEVTAAGLVAQTVREDELVLVSAPDRGDRPLSNDDHLIAFPPGCSYRAALERSFAGAGTEPGAVQEFRGVDAVLGCTAAGLGVTALPRAIAENSRWPVAISELPTELRSTRTYWVYRREAGEIPSIARVTELVTGGV